MSALSERIAVPRLTVPRPGPGRRVRRERPRAWRVSILVLAGLFYLVPLGCSIKFSLIQGNGKYGIENYLQLAKSAALRDSLFTSLEIAGITSVLVIALLLPTAVLVRLKLPKLTILMEVVTILPIVVPPIVMAAGLSEMQASAPLWLVKLFFNHPLTALTPIYVILAMPLVYRAIDTGLRAVDLHTLVDASRSLGAGWFTTLTRVVLPNVQTAVLGGMFLTIALVLGELVISTQLEYTTFPVEMIQVSQTLNTPGVAVALSLMALAFTFLLLFLLTFLARRRGPKTFRVV